MVAEPGTSADQNMDSLKGMSDEDLVELFVKRSSYNRDGAHKCFEVIIARYQWLINHVVRSSRLRFPAWDSADDVIARVVFKVYRGLAQWRKDGKLSSFIARIASSEMIDTIRRVGRDKAWDHRESGPETDVDEPSPVDNAPSPDPSPEAQVVNRERQTIISNLLADVCRDWKDSIIVNEYIINNLGAKDISEKYSISEDLIYQRARRLRVRLLKWLEERGITSAEQLLAKAQGSAGA